MKKLFLIFSFLIVHLSAFSQFNQDLSINLSAGVFKTFGEKFTDAYGPYQMPNYGPGPAFNAGIQIRLGDHFSLAAGLGMLLSNRWNYKTESTDNWLWWTINDPETDELLAEGEYYLDLHNWSLAVSPKIYLTGERKLRPYLSAGVTLNLTNCWFENTYWYAAKDLGLLGPDDTEPWNDNLERNIGIGFNPALGFEISPEGRFHFYADAGLYFIALNKKSFYEPARVENFKTFLFQAGVRYNFLKAKEL